MALHDVAIIKSGHLVGDGSVWAEPWCMDVPVSGCVCSGRCEPPAPSCAPPAWRLTCAVWPQSAAMPADRREAAPAVGSSATAATCALGDVSVPLLGSSSSLMMRRSPPVPAPAPLPDLLPLTDSFAYYHTLLARKVSCSHSAAGPSRLYSPALPLARTATRLIRS